jgi:hypothetical protein
MRITAVAVLLAMAGAPALATATVAPMPATVAPAADTDDEDIVVIGDNGGTFRLTGDALRDAAQAYRRHRAAFAPDSRLYFEVIPAEGTSLAGTTLHLRARRANRDGDHERVELPLDSDRRFILPTDVVIGGQWDLRSNRPSSAIRVRPIVLSSGSIETDRRFGDARLQCRVSIAFARLSLPVRMLAGAIGPCGSSRFALYLGVRQPLERVSISGYDQPIQYRTDRRSFRVPLQDATIGNEARLRLVYR